jgi:hypothetical protein
MSIVETNQANSESAEAYKLKPASHVYKYQVLRVGPCTVYCCVGLSNAHLRRGCAAS